MSQSKISIKPNGAIASSAENIGEPYAELKYMLSKMQMQQEVMAKQLKEFAAIPIVQNSCEYQQLKSLATCLPLFKYPSETFDEWYFKYGEMFKEDTAPLNDQAKVQLLLSRLGESEYQKYTKSIAPLRVQEASFCQTIAKLMSLFAKTKSRTTRRLQCFQLQREENEEFISYGQRVDKAFCAGEMGEISPEEFKCVIFVSGLKSPKEAGLREWLIEQMDKRWYEPLKFCDLLALCDQFKDNNSQKGPVKPTMKTESDQSKVWYAVHLDFFYTDQIHIVVLFDAYSHWPEVYVFRDSKAATIVECMQTVFSRLGLPEMLVLSCDSCSTQVKSKLFLTYCKDNQILRLIPSGPYMSSQEVYLKFKEELKLVLEDRTEVLGTETWTEVIRSFLTVYRTTSFPGAPDQKNPAEIMLGRRFRVKEDAPPEYLVSVFGTEYTF